MLNDREWKLIQGRGEGRPKVDGLKLHIPTAAAAPSFVLSCFVRARHKPWVRSASGVKCCDQSWRHCPDGRFWLRLSFSCPLRRRLVPPAQRTTSDGNRNFAFFAPSHLQCPDWSAHSCVPINLICLKRQTYRFLCSFLVRSWLLQHFWCHFMGSFRNVAAISRSPQVVHCKK